MLYPVLDIFICWFTNSNAYRVTLWENSFRIEGMDCVENLTEASTSFLSLSIIRRQNMSKMIWISSGNLKDRWPETVFIVLWYLKQIWKLKKSLHRITQISTFHLSRRLFVLLPFVNLSSRNIIHQEWASSNQLFAKYSPRTSVSKKKKKKFEYNDYYV